MGPSGPNDEYLYGLARALKQVRSVGLTRIVMLQETQVYSRTSSWPLAASTYRSLVDESYSRVLVHMAE